MTSRDVLRWLSLLTVLEGLAVTIGSRRTIRLIQNVTPTWYRLWLQPLANLSPSALRAIGVVEALLGLRVLAMAPPAPRILRDIASTALEPARGVWQATVGRPADRAFDHLLRQYVPPGARILDLGCGAGDNLARILDAGLPFGSYVGVDCLPDALAHARARFDGIPKVDFLSNDLLNDQLPTGEFDLILSAWSLDRAPDPFALVVRAMRQLRQGGHAMLLFASAPSDRRARLASSVAHMLGRQLHPARIYAGLPSFSAAQEFAGGLASLVILENPAPATAPVAALPPEETRY